MKTNILVQYHGGGYDGCFWEWNYFYIDKQGNFHDIESSGRAGIDNLQDAEKLIEDDANSTYIYDVSKDEDITMFAKKSNAVHVIGVLQWFNNNLNKLNVQFFAVCGECGCQMGDCEDIVSHESNIILCQDCFSFDECPCCKYYVDETEIVQVNQDEHYGFDYICVDCKDYHDEEREAGKIE